MNKHLKYKFKLSRILISSGWVSVLFLTPFLVSAQGIDDFSDLVTELQGVVNLLIPLVASLALLAFFWGLAKYVFHAGNEETKDKGRRVMIGGIIALFLIASVAGIIEFIATALDINTGESIDPPRIMYNEGDGIG